MTSSLTHGVLYGIVMLVLCDVAVEVVKEVFWRLEVGDQGVFRGLREAEGGRGDVSGTAGLGQH